MHTIQVECSSHNVDEFTEKNLDDMLMLINVYNEDEHIKLTELFEKPLERSNQQIIEENLDLEGIRY